MVIQPTLISMRWEKRLVKEQQQHAWPSTHLHNRWRSYNYPKLMQGIWPSQSCWGENKCTPSQILVLIHATIQPCCPHLHVTVMGNKTTDWMCFHSRFIKIWRMERLGVVCIQRVAVVESERLPSFLVFGKVPAGGELRLESLWGHKRWRGKIEDFRHEARGGNENQKQGGGKTHPNFPEQITDNVEGWYSGRGGQRWVAAIAIW